MNLIDVYSKSGDLSLLILIDPDFPLETYYSPYKTLNIRAYYFPIDTRLNFTQASSILSDIAPKVIVIPDAYAGKLSGCQAAEQIRLCEGEEVTLNRNKKRRKRVHVDHLFYFLPN